MTQGIESIDELAETILRYVASCPDACDTVDGICDWWIPRQRYVESKNQVLAALQLLNARGEIDMRTGVDGQVVYRARRTPAS
jgi:hypothetical protein